MPNQVVKVKRERIAACITCPLCHKLFRDATTISECLHTCKSLSLYLFLWVLVNVSYSNFEFSIWVCFIWNQFSWINALQHLGVFYVPKKIVYSLSIKYLNDFILFCTFGQYLGSGTSLLFD